MNGKKKIRYCSALAMIALMVGVAELTGEREIIFPEMAALTIGLWISVIEIGRASCRERV